MKVNTSPSGSISEQQNSSSLSPAQPRGSWRQAILQRAISVTPGTADPRTLTDDGDDACSSDRPVLDTTSNTTAIVHKHDYRALWKKAIMEQILLIRMEKENKTLKVHQDAASVKRLKLDYEEVTPCLADVIREWDEMLTAANRTKNKIDRDVLTAAVRQGIPKSKRGEIWQLLIEQDRLANPKQSDPECGTENYRELLHELTSNQHAILIDLARTFPSHPYFAEQLGAGQLSLFNLLKAYSLLDKEVGYCQGLSFVAGIMLMHLDEDDAFKQMQYLMFNLSLRRQYKPDMIALQIQMYQLSRLLHDRYRDLYEHFELYDIAPTLYAAPWFLTMYASQFPLGFVSRVFDVLFLQGVQAIFKVALVLLGQHRELILQCDSFESIVEFIKTTLPSMDNIRMEQVLSQVFDEDIAKSLHAYEVEYHVLQEEMAAGTPQRSDIDQLEKLEQANRNLKQQNMELLEQLQVTRNQLHNMEATITSYHTKMMTCKARVKTLEFDRAMLFSAVNKMKAHLPPELATSLTAELPPETGGAVVETSDTLALFDP